MIVYYELYQSLVLAAKAQCVLSDQMDYVMWCLVPNEKTQEKGK